MTVAKNSATLFRTISNDVTSSESLYQTPNLIFLFLLLIDYVISYLKYVFNIQFKSEDTMRKTTYSNTRIST
jgi:hypothetical protein